MPNLTTTVEDTSPVIIYSGGWQTGSSTNDVSLEKYSESSYMRTNVSQASASFAFYGNGVQIFGAKRQNYSRYQVSIDSKTYPIRDASVTDPQGTFQTSLFNTIALAEGYHTVHLTNIDQAPLDLDFITWQTPVGSGSDVIKVVTAQESSFEYTPTSEWNSNVPNPGMFSGGSGYMTYSVGASAKFTFKVGSALQLFGPVGPSCASYSVSLDAETPLNYSASKPFYRPGQLLFQASHLSSGEHSITVRPNVGTNSSVYFAIDYAQVFTPSSWDNGGLSVAQIVGIVVGSVCGLLLLAAAVLLIRSKRAKYFLLKKKPEIQNPRNASLVIEPFSDLQTPPATSPLYDTQAFTPQNLKGQLSRGTMVQRYSHPDLPLTASSFSGENLYNQPELTPFPSSPISTSSAQPGLSPIRTPRILDEKRRPPSDTVEMAQSTSAPPVIVSEDSPPVYLK